jgi:hypothetical protein
MLAIAIHFDVGTGNTLLDIALNLCWGWEHHDLLISYVSNISDISNIW